MTRDSGSERPQRTVAELLAEYGGATGDAPRRRRRRAEDDGDSAPQTIIERVLSDSGKLLPIRDDQQAGPRRPGGHRSGERRPAAPPPAHQQPPQGPPSGYAEPVRPPAQQPQPPTGRQPKPGRPVQQPPAAEPQRQFPPSRPGPQVRPVQQPAAPPAPQAPPAAPQTQSRPALRPAARPPAGPPQLTPRPPAGPQRPPVDDDNIATAVHPPLPDDYQPPAAQQQAPPQPPKPAQPPTMQAPPVQAPRVGRGGLPPEATTEEFPLVPGEPQGQQATQRRPPAPQPPLESTQAHAGPYVDDDLGDFEDEFAGSGSGIGAALRGDEAFPSRDDDFDDIDDDQGHAEPFEADREPRSSTREWLLMAAQVGVGAIAGAAVWLAFSWLWGIQPVVGLVAAVLVIFGLVLGVRRWRRAEDLQTTVLAVLAGLVVTVSPAALLLLHR
ncbi:MAG TPA: hypothetical protein VHV49_05695 [Pseudonocardiaceae bacterium]|jgi:hypothetical protein|nr:hypothetical protein [Pseudonocardiaceae bacterium]